MKIELLKRSLNETREQMKALLVKAESETRSMDQQELAKFDELKGKAESLKATIQAAADLEETELRAMPSQGDIGATKPAPTRDELRNWMANGEVAERSMTTTNTAAVVIPAVQKSIQEKMVAASPLRRLAAGFTTDALTYGVPVQVTGAEVKPGDETTARGETAAPTIELAEATLVEHYAQPMVSQRILDGNGGGYDLEGFMNGSVAKAYITKDNQLHADLLVTDDLDARRAAAANGISVTGTLGVVMIASQRGLIDLVDTVRRLQTTTLRLPKELLDELLGPNHED